MFKNVGTVFLRNFYSFVRVFLISEMQCVCTLWFCFLPIFCSEEESLHGRAKRQ